MAETTVVKAFNVRGLLACARLLNIKGFAKSKINGSFKKLKYWPESHWDAL